MIQLNKIIAIIPIHSKCIKNDYIDELESIHITSIFTSDDNELCIIKYKGDTEPDINELFNQTYNANISSEEASWIFHSNIKNIDIYILLVDNTEIISNKMSYNIVNNNKQYFWKIFIDNYKDESDNIYQNILNNDTKYKNKHITDYILTSKKYNLNIKLENLYNTLFTNREKIENKVTV